MISHIFYINISKEEMSLYSIGRNIASYIVILMCAIFLLHNNAFADNKRQVFITTNNTKKNTPSSTPIVKKSSSNTQTIGSTNNEIIGDSKDPFFVVSYPRYTNYVNSVQTRIQRIKNTNTEIINTQPTVNSSSKPNIDQKYSIDELEIIRKNKLKITRHFVNDYDGILLEKPIDTTANLYRPFVNDIIDNFYIGISGFGGLEHVRMSSGLINQDIPFTQMSSRFGLEAIIGFEYNINGRFILPIEVFYQHIFNAPNPATTNLRVQTMKRNADGTLDTGSAKDFTVVNMARLQEWISITMPSFLDQGPVKTSYWNAENFALEEYMQVLQSIMNSFKLANSNDVSISNGLQSIFGVRFRPGIIIGSSSVHLNFGLVGGLFASNLNSSSSSIQPYLVQGPEIISFGIEAGVGFNYAISSILSLRADLNVTYFIKNQDKVKMFSRDGYLDTSLWNKFNPRLPSNPPTIDSIGKDGKTKIYNDANEAVNKANLKIDQDLFEAAFSSTNEVFVYNVDKSTYSTNDLFFVTAKIGLQIYPFVGI